MATTIRHLAFLAILGICIQVMGQEEDTQLQVVRVTPSGDEVPVTRGEIIIDFNKNMAAFGQTDQDLTDVPVEIKPELECTWRWTSANQLTCVHEALRYTTSYVISIGTSLQALDGSMLDSTHEVSFRTASLGVFGTNSLWRSPTRPIFEISFSQPMALGTILDKVHIRDLKTSELHEVKVMHSVSLPRWRQITSTFFHQNEEGEWIRASDAESAEYLLALRDGGIDPENYAEVKREFATRSWMVEPLAPLKPDTPYDLEVASNAKSIFASEPTKLPMHISRFEVYPAFEFLGLECLDTKGSFKQHLIDSSDNMGTRLTDCDPDRGITLLFTAPAKAHDVKYRSLISPKPEDDRNYARARFYTMQQGVLAYISRFELPGDNQDFASNDDLSKVNIGYQLTGNTTYELKVGDAPLFDVFARYLTRRTTVEFRTGPLKPRLNFLFPWLVMGVQSNLDVPVDVANLSDLRVRLAARTGSNQRWSVSRKRQSFEIPPDQIVPATLDFKNWLPSRTLQFVANIEPIADPQYGENPTTTCIYGQVTPYDVQARIGHTSSIAWVTDLQTGQVVPDASVSLVEIEQARGSVVAEATTNKQGIAPLPGKSVFSAGERERRWQVPSDVFDDENCLNPFPATHALYIEGPKGNSILPLSHTLLTNSDYASSVPVPHLSVWGHTAQGLYRPGQVVQYKIFVREQTDKGLRSDETRRFRLVVTQGYGELVHHENGIEPNQFGSFHGEFTIPKAVRTDRNLRFLVMIDKGESFSSIWNAEDDSLNYSEVEYWKAFEVEVLDFDPATIYVEVSLDENEYELGDTLNASGRADLISGGQYSNAPITIETRLRSKGFVSQHPETKEFSFVSASDQYHNWTLKDFQTDSTSTDSEGVFDASLLLDIADVDYGSLTLSLGVQEDSGNIIWENTRATYFGADRFVGLRHKGKQARVGETVTVDTVVVNQHGEPLNDLPVNLSFFRVLSHFNNTELQEKLVHTCEIAPDLASRSCSVAPSEAGQLRVVATINTADGRNQEAIQFIYVQGRVVADKREQWDNVRIANARELRDRSFSVGEFASLVVEHSVPGSMALVTIERLGILDHWVTELEGTHDVIDIPIRQHYAPIVRATVTVTTTNSVTKPRSFVAAVDQEVFPNSWTRTVDLRVKDATRLLDLQITTDKEVYVPGETVRVEIVVDRSAFQGSNPTTELAVAVVDQGVLEMSRAGIGHYNPVTGLLEGMNIDVDGYWLLSQGITVASMSRLGADFDTTPRSNEDLTSLWMPNFETSRDGTASFEFEIGDRLTEWRIIVVAASTTEHFGLGQQSIRTNLGVEVRPALPNQVTDGDIFDATFSVLNRSDTKRDVDVTIEADGDSTTSTHTESIALEPFERKMVSATIQARLDQNGKTLTGSIRLIAKASTGSDSDALVQKVPVHPRKRDFVSSIYGTSIDRVVAEPVEFPTDIADGTGSLEVQVAPSLINALEDRVAQVRDYPYKCWEQRLSSAVVAAQFSKLSERMSIDWEDARQYIQDVLESASEFQSANSGGFGYWSGESIHPDLYLSAYTALAFRWLADAGFEVPPVVLQNLLEYLEDYTVYRLPDYLSIDNSATPSLRLMLANALVQHGNGDLELVGKLYEENKNPNLFSVAQTLEATISLDAKSDMAATLATRLTNSIGVTGDRALIQHGAVSRRNYMLSSQLKTTCSAISSFVRASNRGVPLISQERLAELVRGVMFEWNRRKFGATPHESSFCLSAIVEYAESMETVDADFKVDVELVMDDHLSPPRFETNGSAHSLVYTTPLKPDHVGAPAELRLSQTGDSRFYYKATLRYEPAEEQSDRENFGIDIRKAYWVRSGDQWVELDDSHELNRGDVVHVGLYLDIRDQRDFVIVDDPVPGFLQPINLRLAKTNVHETLVSSVGSRGFSIDHLFARANVRGERQASKGPGELIPADMEGEWSVFGYSRWGFYSRQLRNDSVRFASDFLRSGRYRLYWSGRVISTGEFVARPAHAEAMYSPEVYGNSRPQRIATNAD